MVWVEYVGAGSFDPAFGSAAAIAAAAGGGAAIGIGNDDPCGGNIDITGRAGSVAVVVIAIVSVAAGIAAGTACAAASAASSISVPEHEITQTFTLI